MELKKWTTLMVLSLFLVSIVPAVFAESGTGSEGTADTEDAADDAADAAEDAADDAEDTADEAAKAERERAREALKDKREQLREARKTAIEARKDVLEARKDFLSARAKLHGNSATLADKQAFLLASSDKILELLNNLRDRVDASDAENKDETLADIDAAITSMTDAQATVEGINTDTATREEIKAAAQQMQDAWKDAREILKKGAGHVVTARVGLVVKRMDALQDKLDRIVARLEANGADMSATVELQAQFETKLDSAEANLKTAKDLYASGDVKAAHDALVTANTDLKDAHKLLKEIVKSIRDATKPGDFEKAETEASTSTETETGDDDVDDADEAADDDADESSSSAETSTDVTVSTTDTSVSTDVSSGVTVG